MTKKQFGIIFTLMALIVCVGVIAARLNSIGFNDPTDLGQLISQGKEEDKDTDKDGEKQTLGSQDSFYGLRSEREQRDALTLEELKSIVENENIAQGEKDIATNKLIEKNMLMNQEGRIEVGVKNQGFEDALCSIEGNKVRIVVKAEEVTEANSSAIQEIAENISGMSDVIIEAKK